MASIGDLFLRVLADDKGFTADLTKKATAAGDSAGKSLGARMSAGIKGSFKGFGADLKAGLGIGAGIKAFGLLDSAVTGVVNIMGDAVQAAQAEEKSIAGLDAALRANVKGWDGNRDAIEDVLQARMRLGFADDEQRESLKLLIAATKDENKALAIQRTAMDLARLKNISLTAASEALVKVEGGQFRILKSLGIQLPKNATATEALAAVQKVATGQAEAYANTNEGKLLASQVKVGEAMEKLGAVALPLVAEGMSFLSDVITNLVGVGEKVGEVLGGIGFWAGEALAPISHLAEFIGTLHFPWEQAAYDAKVAQDQALADANAFVEAYREEVGSAALHAADEVEENRGYFRTAAENLSGELPTAIQDAEDEAVEIAASTPQDIADALRGAREDWQRAVRTLGEDLENEMSTAAEIAALKAELAGDNIAKGLRSKDPVVRQQAIATRDLILTRLAQLEGEAYQDGKDAGNALAAGLRAARAGVTAAANTIAAGVAAILQLHSPADEGPWSEDGGPEGWGRNFADYLARGIRQSRDLQRAALGVAATLAAATVPMTLATAPAMRFGGIKVPRPPVAYDEVPGYNMPWAATSLGQPTIPTGGTNAPLIGSLQVTGALPVRTIRDIEIEARAVGERHRLPIRRRQALYPVES